MFKCHNPECQETWDTTSSGGLIPGIGGGYWKAVKETKECPCCEGFYPEGDNLDNAWQFVVDRSIKGEYWEN